MLCVKEKKKKPADIIATTVLYVIIQKKSQLEEKTKIEKTLEPQILGYRQER